ncbi:MBL fold metallo-hydrolase [Haloarchaeobius amylolyticus]|uniref:MBL fold metallo-hydrolase n=1 Tax=Haloarchaeobius amylolyticus TaxID=1198296 RepID=UPI00226D5236|nr:MBL fold metallo-hydrolase [Haloarchaeobius amylolyticus]
MTDVVPAVTRIAVPTETRAPTARTNAYVVGERTALLVDPATTNERLDEVVSTHDVRHIAVTHTHSDHVDAVAHYADQTGATVWARQGHEDAFTAATGVEPDRTFREGTVIPDVGVRVLETPGHARDHVSFVAGDSILCGDLAIAEGSVVVGGDGADLRAYLTSLRRLWAMAPGELCPGHGPVLTDPRGQCERLIRHRNRREQKVLGAVVAGAETLDEVLDSAYDKDLSGVRDLAAATVECHLSKLSRAGRIDWDGERASPV